MRDPILNSALLPKGRPAPGSRPQTPLPADANLFGMLRGQAMHGVPEGSVGCGAGRWGAPTPPGFASLSGRLGVTCVRGLCKLRDHQAGVHHDCHHLLTDSAGSRVPGGRVTARKPLSLSKAASPSAGWTLGWTGCLKSLPTQTP